MVSSPARRELRGKLGRGRRELRRRSLEPPTLRDIVMRGHLVSCELDDARFFVDPGDRVVDVWLMRRGGWQRREIQRAVPLLAAAGRITADAVFVDVGADIGTETDYAPHSGRFGRAVAFEPDPYNAELLAMNLKASGLATARSSTQRRPVPQAGALSSTSIRATREHTRSVSRRGSTAAIVSRFRWCGSTKRSASLGLMPRRSGSCEINVEGCEPQVLEGLAVIMKHAVPVAFEFTPERYDAASKARLVERFAAHCTRMYRLGGAAGTAAAVLTLASIDTIDDVLVY
jgi:FkbM family methyltransferase